jgi:hypothetical protein
MFNKSNRSQLLGSFVNIINSALNFVIYIFFPILIGLNSFTNFQLENVKSSFIILMFSPSLPFIVYNRKFAIYTFFVLFFCTGIILFFLSSKSLLIANMLWLLYGFITMILYYNNEKRKFYFYTILLTVIQIITLLCFKDYYSSYLITSTGCFILILLLEKTSIFKFLHGIDLIFSKKILYSLLRPVFSISFFWQILLFIASKQGDDSFLSLTYYSKISLSTTVAIFTISSLDILKEKKINHKIFFILCLLSVFAVNILILVLDFFGKNTLHIGNFIATSFLLVSIFPSIVFNLISDSLQYRIGLFVVFAVAICLIFLGYSILLVTGIGLLIITFVSYYTFINMKDAVTNTKK